jgi:hypothetical protein
MLTGIRHNWRRRAWLIAAAIVVAVLAVVGCTGSEDRTYFDDTQLDGAAADVTVSNDAFVPPDDSGATDAGAEDADADDGDAADAADAGPTHTVGGTVVGLTGSGLVLSLNGTDDLPVSAGDGGVNVPFVFTTALAEGATFTVTIKTQPSSPAQSCAVFGGSATIGTGDVTSVVVNCGTGSFLIGGTVTGLEGSITLKDNGGPPLTLTTNGDFVFNTLLGNGAGYAVTIDSHSALPDQNCVLTNGSGTVAGANVTNVNIACTTNSYSIGGSALYDGGTLILANGADLAPVQADGGFTFPMKVLSNRAYNVTVSAAPPGKTCPVTNGSGTVTNADVTNVSVVCVPQYALQENFDGVTAPALPNGWSSSVVIGNGSTQAFETTAAATTHLSQDDTFPNSCGVPNATAITDIVLVSPSFTVSTSKARLTFKQAFQLEADYVTATVGYDGAVLEISVNGGASWQDIIAAGGTWVTGGYNRNISNGFQNPLAGRDAWSAASGAGWMTTTVSLPLVAGQSAQIRFRVGTDKRNVICGGAPYPSYCEGWRLDTLAVLN